MKWVISFLMGGFISLGLLIFFKLQLYKPVEIEIGDRGPYYLIYAEHQGSYHKTVSTIEKVEAFMVSQRQPCPVSFGYYWDDPRVVSEDRLRSWGGCAYRTDEIPRRIFKNQLKQWQDHFRKKNRRGLKKQIDSLVLSHKDLEFSLKVSYLPKIKYLVGHFEGAPSAGPFKVYPKIYDKAQEERLSLSPSILELYIRKGQDLHTEFLFTIE